MQSIVSYILNFKKLLFFVLLASLFTGCVKFLTFTPYNRERRSYDSFRNYVETNYKINSVQVFDETKFIKVLLEGEANKVRLLEIARTIENTNSSKNIDISFLVESSNLPIDYLNQGLIKWASARRSGEAEEIRIVLSGWHSGHLKHLIQKMQAALEAKGDTIKGIWVTQNFINFLIHDSESPTKWRYEDIDKSGNNYREGLTPKKNLNEGLTGSSNINSISFEIPIGVKSVGNLGTVTCTENSCGDLTYNYWSCKNCGEMKRPNISELVKNIP
tara:strand:+ start:624 stop:1445 length:822 start_codon:yes stop_codon:yes gene_type:complete